MLISIILIENEYVNVNNWFMMLFIVFSFFVYILLLRSFFRSIFSDWVMFEYDDILFLNRSVLSCV